MVIVAEVSCTHVAELSSGLCTGGCFGLAASRPSVGHNSCCACPACKETDVHCKGAIRCRVLMDT